MIDREEGITRVGLGWRDVANTFYDMVDLIQDATGAKINVTKVEANRGFFHFECEDVPEKYQNLLNRIFQSLRATSAVTCEICGKKGLRRKYFRWVPTLCREHFIDSANRADEWKRWLESQS